MSYQLPDDVLIKADTLRRNAHQDREIQELVMDIVKSCNEAILQQHQKGKRDAVVPLPYSFNIPEMSNADSQRRVWATVIQILVNAGYDVQIEFDAQRCQLHCNWLSQKERSNMSLWDSILRKHQLRSPDKKKGHTNS